MQWPYRLWRIIRWPLGIFVVLYIGVVIFSIPHALEKIKTEETVARIHSQKLTIENVNGEHLPPPPDPAQVDATVEGVDANMNGIRDDVEIAIFEKYPNSAKIRAAELQYAMALQTHLTHVFNKSTWREATHLGTLSMNCIKVDTLPPPELSANKEQWYEYDDRGVNLITEVRDLVLNTDPRRLKYKQIPAGEAIAYFPTRNNPRCDLDLSLLPN